MELILVVSHGNSWEIKAVFGRLVTAAKQGKEKQDKTSTCNYTAPMPHISMES